MDTCDLSATPAWPSPELPLPVATVRDRLAHRMAQIVATAISTDNATGGVADLVASLTATGLADWAGTTTLVPDGKGFQTVAQTHELVRIIDAIQYRHREGPCVHAAAQQEVVSSSQLDSDARWPTWAPRAARVGVAAVLSIPLHDERTRFGALNLYRGTRTHYGHDDLQWAQLAATHITALMAHQRVQHHLRVAVEARTVIGRAQGMLMERFRLTPDQAFETLRRYSQDGNIKLHLVAEKFVATGKLPDNIPAPRGPLADTAGPSDHGGGGRVR